MRSILQQFHAMLSGPGHLRFIIQPALAILLGLRDGRIDSHAGLRPLDAELRALHGAERWGSVRKTLRRILVPLCLAIGLSLVFQYVIQGRSRLLPALSFAVFLVALPYFISRSIANRIDGRWHVTHPRQVSSA
jgi:hypothetical protein